MTEPLPTIAVKRRPSRPLRVTPSKSASFAWGVVAGVVLSQVLGVILYAVGVLGISSPLVIQPPFNGVQSLGLNAHPNPNLHGLLVTPRIESAIRNGNAGSNPAIALAVSRLNKTQAEFLTADPFNQTETANLFRRHSRDFNALVDAVKDHALPVAAELAADPDTAVYFQ